MRAVSSLIRTAIQTPRQTSQLAMPASIDRTKSATDERRCADVPVAVLA
jgi:hypothetical protein